MTPPYFDPRIQYISPTKIRTLTAPELKRLKHPLFVLVEGKVVAVIAPIDVYADLQAMAVDKAISPLSHLLPMVAE